MMTPPTSAQIHRALAAIQVARRHGVDGVEVALAEMVVDVAAACWDDWTLTDEFELIPGAASIFHDPDALRVNFAQRFTAPVLH